MGNVLDEADLNGNTVAMTIEIATATGTFQLQAAWRNMDNPSAPGAWQSLGGTAVSAAGVYKRTYTPTYTGASRVQFGIQITASVGGQAEVTRVTFSVL